MVSAPLASRWSSSSTCDSCALQVVSMLSERLRKALSSSPLPSRAAASEETALSRTAGLTSARSCCTEANDSITRVASLLVSAGISAPADNQGPVTVCPVEKSVVSPGSVLNAALCAWVGGRSRVMNSLPKTVPGTTRERTDAGIWSLNSEKISIWALWCPAESTSWLMPITRPTRSPRNFTSEPAPSWSPVSLSLAVALRSPPMKPMKCKPTPRLIRPKTSAKTTPPSPI